MLKFLFQISIFIETILQLNDLSIFYKKIPSEWDGYFMLQKNAISLHLPFYIKRFYERQI